MLKKCFIGIIAGLFISGCFNYAYSEEIFSGYIDENGRVLTILEGIDMVTRDSRLIEIELAGKDMSFEDTINALSPLLPHIGIDMGKTYYRFTPQMIIVYALAVHAETFRNILLLGIHPDNIAI